MPDSDLETHGREKRRSLREAVLGSYRDEYKELGDAWRGLETKAQGTVAIAGIFLAGAFAYIREISAQTSLGQKLLLVCAIVCLVTSVCLSVLALEVRRVAAPLVAGRVDQLVKDLLAVADDNEFLDRLPDFYSDQAAAWREVNQQSHEANQSKARRVWNAQGFLLAAIILVALLLLARVFS